MEYSVLTNAKKRYSWPFQIVALVAITPLLLTLEFNVNSILAILAIGMLFLSSFLFGKQGQAVEAADTAIGKRAQGFVSNFEDNGLGWFWETDREGRLTYISNSISASLGKKHEELVGLKFASILSDSKIHDDKQEWMTFSFHLSSRTSFHDLPFNSAIDANRFWSISGGPIYDQLGNYQGFRGNGLDLSEMRESERALNQLARCDTLTGLANRLEINRTLERSLAGPRGLPSKCSLFLLDLDKFKPVNDTMGHPAGDRLLQIAGQVILDTIGDKGQVGRIGGDEFQIVLPAMTDRAELEILANQVIENLSRPCVIEGQSVGIGASIGISIYEADTDGIAATTLVRDADLALYAAKNSGRGVCRFYSPSMLEQASEQREFEEDLRQALSKGQLSLVYQPIIDISTETLCGFEALIRWEHPRKGFINPEKFIKMAEELYIIPQIGDWTIRTVCAQIKAWNTDLRVAVNVSPIQFKTGNLVTTVISAIASTAIRPSQLELEITEGVFLEEDTDSINIFNRLKKSGVRLVLDDFGTGYSALGYLHKVPFDKLKIDQSFVRGAGQKGNMNSAIISSIVTLAEALGMDTTAEGVETIEELEFVHRLGCSQVQGYIYGKPLNLKDATALIEASGNQVSVSGFSNFREERRKTLRSIKLRYDEYWYEGMVKNISRHGAMIEGLENIEDGSQFQIDLGNGLTVTARSIWSAGKQMGIRFREPVNPANLSAAPPTDIGRPISKAS